MKKIKKIGKRILCGLIAAVSMLSVTLPVYAIERIYDMPVTNMKHLLAAKTATDSDGYYSYNISYTGYAPDAENPGSFGLFYVKDNSCWNMMTIGAYGTFSRSMAISKSANSPLYNTGGSGRSNSDYNGGKLTGNTCYASSDGSWIPLKDWFSSNEYLGLVKIDGSEVKSIYNIMVDKYGQSKVDNLLSSYYVWNFANMASTVDDPWQNKDTYETFNYSGKEYDNWVDLLDYLMTDPSFDNDDADYLPMLDYQISKKHGLQFANDFIVFNVHVKWDHTKTVPYSENLNRYKVEIRAVQSLSDLNEPGKYKTVILKSTTADSTSFGAEEFAEILGYNGDNLQGSKGYLYSFAIRTIDTESDAVSFWKTWTIGSSGHGRNPTITPGQNNYDKDGNVVTKDTSKEDDSVDNSGIEKDPDGTSNDAKKDPSSDAYEDADGKVSATGTLSSLKQIILSLGDVPKLLALCLTWLPDSFSVLISASLTMIVIIGVIRWFK